MVALGGVWGMFLHHVTSYSSARIGTNQTKGENQRPPASWGYEDGPWKGPGPPLLGAADFV